MLEHKELTAEIISAAIEVHCELGPGLLESIYESCLARELTGRGLSIRRQIELPITYKGEPVGPGYRIDMLVNDLVLLELKAVDRLEPVHEAQLLTYMKLARIPVGFLLNFNVEVMKAGIVRRVLTQSSPPRTPRLRGSLKG